MSPPGSHRITVGAQHQRLRALFIGGEIMNILKQKIIGLGGVLKSVYIH